jgi:hypothetical protein
MRIPDSAMVVATSELLSSEFGPELIVLNLRDGIYYGLEGVGARIWSIISHPVTVSAIRDMLVSEYDVEAEQCERDIQDLLTDLRSKGLIEIREQN